MTKLLNLPPAACLAPLVHGFLDDFDVPVVRGSKDIPLGSFQEIDGTTILDFSAGDSVIPGWAAEAETGGVRWNNHATPDPITTTFTMPRDIDTSYPAILRIRAAKTGATGGDAVTWAVGAFNNALAALYDADTDYGGASSAMTGAATAKTVQESTLALAAADLGTPGDSVYLSIQPTDGTLGTDDVILISIELDYVKKDQPWAILGDAAGSVTYNDAGGGTVSIATGAGDNDEKYIARPLESFLPVADKPSITEFRLQYTEANTDDANIFAGLAQEAGANLLVDDGAGVAATLDGVYFYKVDGGTRWQIGNSNATTQDTDDTEDTAGSSGYHTLRLEINPLGDGTADIVFSIDTNGGQDFKQCRANGANPRTPSIKQNVTLAGLAEMHVVLGAKAGGANAETLVVDYAQSWQKR
jgi:hypothetical protein